MCLILQQVASPLQSAVPVANRMSSRPGEQYLPTSDTYWAQTGSDQSYPSHSRAPAARYRSVFLLGGDVKCI